MFRVPTTVEDARMWCFGIARNTIREHYRRATKQLATADGLREHIRHTAQDNAADTVTEAQMRVETVIRALGLLDERSRELVKIIHWDGFSTADAARILTMNQSSARTRYARAITRLKDKLQDENSHAELLDGDIRPNVVIDVS